ncbi:hypothetical protein ACQ4PT_059676 [Festuca glaucescens]
MDDFNGASPDRYRGGGGGSIPLVCDGCGFAEVYSPDDFSEDGFFSCSKCNAVHTHTPETVVEDDFGITSRIPQPAPAPYPIPPYHPQHDPLAAAFNEFHEPRDFVSWGEPEELGSRIRRRYVQGLQVILQRQLEVLVDSTRWARSSAASLEPSGCGGSLPRSCSMKCGQGQQKHRELKCEWVDEASTRKDRRGVQFVFLRSLRTMLPLYSTLSICFLACHIAREAILPTDIYRWAMEGKLPYMAAFTQVDTLLGSSLKQHCSLNARQLFRPVRVIGAWQLEAAAGSIARRIGLRLPSVNFYAIAQRYLNELSLPVERILPHACRIYEWAMPAELWLSSNPARVPTRVCAMAILIVVLRVLYNINGQGIWEEISEAARNAGESDPDANLPPSMKPNADSGTTEEFGARELLFTLADAYDKNDVAHGNFQ